MCKKKKKKKKKKKPNAKHLLISWQLIYYIYIYILTNKIKRSFFPSSGRIDTAIWMPHMDAN